MFGRNNESENTNAALGEHSSTENRRGQSSHDRILEGNHDVSAFVGEGVEFKGVISYQGTIRIDGQLEGEIHTDGVLLVGRGAVISAKVEAGTIVCQGRIVGDIVAREKIQLLAPGVLDGSLKTPSLSMEEGVIFNGTCEMGPQVVRDAQFGEEQPVGSFDEGVNVV
ncbi:MAG: polymer-forming cytoskeletal protein [Nitrospirales bacterium]